MMKGMMEMTDAMFVTMTIKHHQQGIEMARLLEEERGSTCLRVPGPPRALGAMCLEKREAPAARALPGPRNYPR